MVLGFKEFFKDGKKTDFSKKIFSCVLPAFQTTYRPKKHSIRKGNRWKEGDKIHMAYGVRTKNYWQFNVDIEGLENVISTQKIIIRNSFNDRAGILVDGRELLDFEIGLLAANDGFDTTDDFWDFFKGEDFHGQVIHWTDFKY